MKEEGNKAKHRWSPDLLNLLIDVIHEVGAIVGNIFLSDSIFYRGLPQPRQEQPLISEDNDRRDKEMKKPPGNERWRLREWSDGAVAIHAGFYTESGWFLGPEHWSKKALNGRAMDPCGEGSGHCLDLCMTLWLRRGFEYEEWSMVSLCLVFLWLTLNWRGWGRSGLDLDWVCLRVICVLSGSEWCVYL